MGHPAHIYVRDGCPITPENRPQHSFTQRNLEFIIFNPVNFKDLTPKITI